jgi:hypothetical protein
MAARLTLALIVAALAATASAAFHPGNRIQTIPFASPDCKGAHTGPDFGSGEGRCELPPRGTKSVQMVNLDEGLTIDFYTVRALAFLV